MSCAVEHMGGDLGCPIHLPILLGNDQEMRFTRSIPFPMKSWEPVCLRNIITWLQFPAGAVATSSYVFWPGLQPRSFKPSWYLSPPMTVSLTVPVTRSIVPVPCAQGLCSFFVRLPIPCFPVVVSLAKFPEGFDHFSLFSAEELRTLEEVQ